MLKFLLYVVAARWLLGLDGNYLLADSPDAMMPASSGTGHCNGAEFVISTAVGRCTIHPNGIANKGECTTMKAFVRT